MSSNLSPELDDGLPEEDDSPATSESLLRNFQAKVNGLERDLRRLLALVIVYVSLQGFFYITSIKTFLGRWDLALIVVIGINLLFSRKAVIELKDQVWELRSAIKEGESPEKSEVSRNHG